MHYCIACVIHVFGGFGTVSRAMTIGLYTAGLEGSAKHYWATESVS